ncbi:unnamed protein product [Adineta steineri]|uniref:Uncharacterized protein n=1 Tax=Adineta steineri TaxID=433720 RepID=A0A814YE70_9BILA|nr:unnamed protein product [Adineta steineri]
MFCSSHIFLLLTVIGLTSGVANNSYQNCLQIAARFATTVTNGPVADIRMTNGKQVTSGFDVCNGMFYDSIGNYAYFATTTYPYITGCFGPANYPNAKPNCTTNPAQSYTKSIYAASMSTSVATILNVSSSIATTSNVSSSIINLITFFMIFTYMIIIN